MPIDNYNMLKVLEDFPEQCKTALELTKGLTVQGDIKNIIVAGMGGSGIAGDILRAYISSFKIPVNVVKDYKLPEFVDANTLVFAVSYSGNTEETLSAYYDAVKKKAKIVAITSGGELAKLCKKTIKIPSGYQPRAALGFLFFPILGVLSNANVIDVKTQDVAEMLSVTGNVESYKKEAQHIAKTIRNRVPVVYSSNLFGVAAYRWKCQFNENSKIAAFYNIFSEMNHNEVVGYQSMDRAIFISIMLKDKYDDTEIKKRMDVTKKIIETKADVIEVNSRGDSFLARLFSLIYVGDFASYYHAINNRIDPTPVAVIENLKKELKKCF